MRILDFTERAATASKTPSTASFNLPNNFVTLDSFNALKGDVEALRGKLDDAHAILLSASNGTGRNIY